MKNFVFLIILSLLMAGPVFSKENYTIKSDTFTYQSKDKRLSISIKYPEITGISDSKLQKKLNDFFKKEFLTGYEDVYCKKVNFEDSKDLEFCHDDLDKSFGKEFTFSIDIGHVVKACKNNILSVSSYGLGILVPSAHPTKFVNTFTVDLRDGKVYTFKELFKSGVNYMAVMEKLIKKHGYYVEKNGNTYDFYLTPSELVLVNTNSPYAIQGETGVIKFSEIKDIINPKGPIGIITAK